MLFELRRYFFSFFQKAFVCFGKKALIAVKCEARAIFVRFGIAYLPRYYADVVFKFVLALQLVHAQPADQLNIFTYHDILPVFQRF